MIEYISIICWILAASCNAVMDTLVHHYTTSIFIDYNPKFWNPKISWKNKYKDGVKVYGPAFFLSTGLLVAFTDAWHFFKSLQIVLLGVAMVCVSDRLTVNFFNQDWLNSLVELTIWGILWNVPFSFMYNRVLKK